MEEIVNHTEQIKLSSEGEVYPLSNPLSKGVIEIKYPTTAHEDILSNTSLMEKGTVLDKYIQSLIVTPINYGDLVTGDKDSIMIAARILGIGPKYYFTYKGKPEVIDLEKLDNKPFDKSLLIAPNTNEFKYKFDSKHCKSEITWKLLTHTDEKAIEKEIEGLKKIFPDSDPSISTRLKFIITSVDGHKETQIIREFVDKMKSTDSREFRTHIKKIQPGVNLTFFPEGSSIPSNIPIGVGLFWPELE